MAVYIAGFSLSSLFVWLSEKNKKIKIFGIATVGILTFIAAIRGLDIGIDIKFYVLKTFSVAKIYRGNFLKYMSYNPDQVEPLYLVTEYVAANVFNNVHFALFVFSALANSFIYLGIKNLRNRLNVTLGWIAYCFLFYSVTLNLMRQFIAVAIIFYLFSDSARLNWKRTVFFSLIAMGFHISGFMGIFLYIVYKFTGMRIKRGAVLKKMGVAAFLLLPFLADIILDILAGAGLLSGKFLIYLDNKGDIALGNMIFRIIGLLSYILYLYKNQEAWKDNWIRFVLYIGIVDILFLINNGLFSLRLGKIFSVFEIAYFIIGMNAFRKKGGSRRLVSVTMVCLLFAYWYYQFVVLNSGLVYPYTIDPKLF